MGWGWGVGWAKLGWVVWGRVGWGWGWGGVWVARFSYHNREAV